MGLYLHGVMGLYLHKVAGHSTLASHCGLGHAGAAFKANEKVVCKRTGPRKVRGPMSWYICICMRGPAHPPAKHMHVMIYSYVHGSWSARRYCPLWLHSNLGERIECVKIVTY